MPYEWFVGIDWGSRSGIGVCVLVRPSPVVVGVDHDGASLAQLVAWLWTLAAGQQAGVSGD